MREPAHVQSQAATLLLIGSHLRGDAAALQARAEAARAPAPLSVREPAVMVPSEDLRALGFPAMPVGQARRRSEDLQETAGVRFRKARAAEPAPADRRAASRSLARTAAAFYRDASPEAAAALLEVSLRHPHELVRVSAAASYFEVAADPQPALRVLERGLRSRDPLTRDVAAHALARVDPRNPRLEAFLRPRRRRSTRRRSRTALIVHGTFARTAGWWQPPGGEFWKYLHDEVDPSVYGAPDRFEWSGSYDDLARALGGADLAGWVQQHGLAGLDLFAHSHGGSVAMLATHAGTAVGRLVLLACPVHWPKYTPDFARVGVKVLSVRVRLDLVILVDGGGQRFTDPRIEEFVLPIWFDHSAPRDPDVWRQHGVPLRL